MYFLYLRFFDTLAMFDLKHLQVKKLQKEATYNIKYI